MNRIIKGPDWESLVTAVLRSESRYAAIVAGDHLVLAATPGGAVVESTADILVRIVKRDETREMRELEDDLSRILAKQEPQELARANLEVEAYAVEPEQRQLRSWLDIPSTSIAPFYWPTKWLQKTHL